MSRRKGWIRMKDFSWKYFALTGDVESYLLYKEIYNQDASLQTEITTIGDTEEELSFEESTL